jgi:hypothetical protein
MDSKNSDNSENPIDPSMTYVLPRNPNKPSTFIELYLSDEDYSTYLLTNPSQPITPCQHFPPSASPSELESLFAPEWSISIGNASSSFLTAEEYKSLFAPESSESEARKLCNDEAYRVFFLSENSSSGSEIDSQVWLEEWKMKQEIERKQKQQVEIRHEEAADVSMDDTNEKEKYREVEERKDGEIKVKYEERKDEDDTLFQEKDRDHINAYGEYQIKGNDEEHANSYVSANICFHEIFNKNAREGKQEYSLHIRSSAKPSADECMFS